MKKKEAVLTIHTYLFSSAFHRFRRVIFFFPAIILFGVIISFFLLIKQTDIETRSLLLPSVLFYTYHPVAYPMTDVFSYARVFGDSLSAQGIIIMDADSKKILFSKNENFRFSMASTTKIMSAIVGLDYYKLDDVLTIQSDNVPPAVVGYPLGEKVKFRDILYGMFLPSGNDAALAVAQNYSGGVQGFISQMNKKAMALSLDNTHFADSSGLDDENYTTVVDLAHLAAYAMKNPLLSEIVSTKQKLTTNADGTKQYYLTNINELLGKYHVDGVKTGFTPEAGGVLITSTEQNGHRVIVIVMKSDDRFGDTEKLLSLFDTKINYLSIVP